MFVRPWRVRRLSGCRLPPLTSILGAAERPNRSDRFWSTEAAVMATKEGVEGSRPLPGRRQDEYKLHRRMTAFWRATSWPWIQARSKPPPVSRSSCCFITMSSGPISLENGMILNHTTSKLLDIVALWHPPSCQLNRCEATSGNKLRENVSHAQ